MPQQKTKKRKEIKGDCYERSAHLLIDGYWNGQKPAFYVGRPMLVHGMVYHPETGWHSHAWVQDDAFCYDFVCGRLLTVLTHDYYRIGKIPSHLGTRFMYTEDETQELALACGYYNFSPVPINI